MATQMNGKPNTVGPEIVKRVRHEGADTNAVPSKET